jgi:hypothetical protein
MWLLTQAEPVSVWAVIQAFFSRAENGLQLLLSAPNRDMLTLQLVAMVGLSAAIGQSVVLFANRVKPLRFVVSVLTAVLIYVVSFLLWVTIVWGLINWGAGITVVWPSLAGAVAVSYIPLLLAFLGFLPYAGQPILRLLYVISLYFLVLMLHRVLKVDMLQTLLFTAAGLAAVLLLEATIGRPLVRLANKILEMAAGTSLKFDLDAAIEAFAAEADGDDSMPSSSGEGA